MAKCLHYQQKPWRGWETKFLSYERKERSYEREEETEAAIA
jgi:hypothetical protein